MIMAWHGLTQAVLDQEFAYEKNRLENSDDGKSFGAQL